MTRALALGRMEHLTVVVLRALAARGIAAAVAGAGPSPAVRISRRCAAFFEVAADEDELGAAGPAVVEKAEAAARRFGAELVVPIDVEGALLAEKLRPRLPGAAFFPFADSATLRGLDDKWLFHQTLEKAGLAHPPARLVPDVDAARALTPPVVLKPRRGAGGHGVRAARDAAALEAAAAASDYPLLAQDFVGGEDVDVSFLADRGRLIAHAVQARRGGAIEYFADPGIAEFARGLAKTTGYTGLAHVDMRYAAGSSGPALAIECNPRFWGTFLHTTGLGVDFLGLGLEISAGRSPAEQPPPVGVVHGARKSLLSGRFSGPSWTHLRHILADPLPELRRAALRLLGRTDPWP